MHRRLQRFFCWPIRASYRLLYLVCDTSSRLRVPSRLQPLRWQSTSISQSVGNGRTVAADMHTVRRYNDISFRWMVQPCSQLMHRPIGRYRRSKHRHLFASCNILKESLLQSALGIKAYALMISWSALWIGVGIVKMVVLTPLEVSLLVRMCGGTFVWGDFLPDGGLPMGYSLSPFPEA